MSSKPDLVSSLHRRARRRGDLARFYAEKSGGWRRASNGGSKGEHMKKSLKVKLSIAALLVAVAGTLVFGACAPLDLLEEKDALSSVLPLGAPKAAAARPVNADMSAQQMMEAGFYNYYAAEYVVSENFSTNDSYMPDTDLSFNTQYIDGYKIRKGVYDEEDPLASQTYHLVISAGWTSGSQRIEEALVADDKLTYRYIDGGSGSPFEFNDDIGMMRVKEGAAAQTVEYGTGKEALEQYNIDVCNDPTKVFTYDIFDTATWALVPGTVSSATEPVYNAREGTYSFSASFNKDVVTKNYIQVLERNLAKQNGGNVEYRSLDMDFVMWEDGHIKSIHIEENYRFTMSGFLSLDNFYIANVYFAYDEQECGYVMADYLNAFENNIGIERTNELYELGVKEEIGGIVISIGEGAGIAAGVIALIVIIVAVSVAAAKAAKKKKRAADEAKRAREDEEELFGKEESAEENGSGGAAKE